LSEKIKQINLDFGFDVPVIVLTADKLMQIIEDNPFAKDPSKNISFFHITFLSVKSENMDYKSI